jgi:hypothetical protein
MTARLRPNLNPRAGGCFLTVSIIGGAFVGLAIGNPMKGILAGTGLGIVLALVLWLLDRRRGPDR